MKPAAWLTVVVLLPGCAFLQPDAPELDLAGVPFTPFVRLHFFANGTAADHEFRVSRDAPNFTWAVQFSAPRASDQTVCVTVPDAPPTVTLTDPSGREAHVAQPAPQVLADEQGCGPEVRALMPGTTGTWRVRITGQGDILGAISAS